MRLIPRETKFFRMFRDVSQNLTEGASLLHDILKNPQDLPVRINRLQEIEHRGDDMTHDIIRMLNQTFITPFDREDIHALTSSLDDVLDYVNSAATRMKLYRITTPPPAAADLAELIVKQSEELSKAVSLLEEEHQKRFPAAAVPNAAEERPPVLPKTVVDPPIGAPKAVETQRAHFALELRQQRSVAEDLRRQKHAVIVQARVNRTKFGVGMDRVTAGGIAADVMG